ncbi:unnamed protein product, partial [Medioppia subpectinata]
FQIRSSDYTSCVCRPGFRPDLAKSSGVKLYCINDTIDCPNDSKPMNGFQCANCLSGLYGGQSHDNDSESHCLCPERHFLVQSVNQMNDTVVDLKCEKCPKHRILASDGKSCKPCHQSYIRASGECVCPKTYVEEDGMCLPEGQLFTKDYLNVISLIESETPDKRFISDYFYRRSRPAVRNCKYESNRTACQLLANLCVLYHYSYSPDTSVESNVCKIVRDSLPLTLAPNIYYKGYFRNELQQNNVPNHFKLNYRLDVESNVCKIVRDSLPLTLAPNIYYKGYFRNELQQNNVPNHFKLNYRLELIASRFAIDGQLIDYSDLKPKELQLCYENEKSSERGFVFNNNFKQSCVRTTRELWDDYKSKNIFFELYLKNTNGNNGINLYPIPVLIRNIKLNHVSVNKDIDGYDTGEEQHSVVLTNRFYLIDSITGIEKSSDDMKLDYNTIQPKFIRIAKSIEIDVRLRKQDGSGSIYPPLITILYETLFNSQSSIRWTTRTPNEFSPINNRIRQHADNRPDISPGPQPASLCRSNRSYTTVSNSRSSYDWERPKKRDTNSMVSIAVHKPEIGLTDSQKEDKLNGDEQNKRRFSLSGSLSSPSPKPDNCWHILLCGCCLVYIQDLRNGKIGIDMMTIVEFLVNAIAMIANMQSVVDTMLSTESQEHTLKTYIIVALALKSIHLIYKLLVISNWERPKKRDTNSMVSIAVHKPEIGLTDSQKEDKLNGDEQNKRRFSLSGSLSSPSPKPVLDKLSYEFPKVTVWRTNFVANEWMELCGHRRLSLSIHIFLVILVLDYFGCANLALSDPSNSLTRDESQRYVIQSTTGRIAVGGLVYAILALLNIAFKKFIYETLLNNKMHQFVDLCSISLFAMQYKRFGYYIHGLAANGKSDVNMLEMYEQLEREESDLCSKRGLLPNTDQQTFEMSLPLAIDEHYRRVRSNLSGFVKISDRMRSFGAHLSKADTEKLIPTYLMINKFLTGFIEHNFKDVDYMVREKSTIESIFDVEFADTRDKGYFYSAVEGGQGWHVLGRMTRINWASIWV